MADEARRPALRVKLIELSQGRWSATIEGEEESAVVEATGDEALARLIRARMARFGISEIIYAVAMEEADGPPITYSLGRHAPTPPIDAPGDQVADGE